MTKKTKKETQVFLNKAVQNLGLEGNLIRVKAGYARNYLLPKNLGILASSVILDRFKREQQKIRRQEEKRINECLFIKNNLEKIKTFSIEKRVSNENRIFGTITSKQILELLANKANVTFVNTKVNAPEMKETGTYSIEIILQPKVIAYIQLTIISK